jgi:hypothetical protein
MERSALRLVRLVLVTECLLGCAQEAELPVATRAPAQEASGPTVTTDKADYRPGEVALLGGEGWTGGEAIALDIACTCGCDDHLFALAGDDGAFDGVEYAIEAKHLGTTCTVTATGQSSGQVATTTFTDGNISIRAAPEGVSFDLIARHYQGNCSDGLLLSEPCPPSAPCPVTASTGPGLAALSTESLKLTAPAVSKQGASFVRWVRRLSSGDLFITGLPEVCLSGGPDATYVAVFECAGPTVDCPADITTTTDPGTCSAANVTLPAAQGGCGAPTPTCSHASGSTFPLGTTPVTCTASTATCSFNVTVLDDEDPTLTCPALTDECPLDVTPTASDNCPDVRVEFSDASEETCGGARDVTRTVTATDGAGRTVTCTQEIAVVDTKAPTLSVPSDQLALECLADTSPTFTGVAGGEDTCSSFEIDHADEGQAGCGQTVTLSRTWTATDACGNATTGTQIIATRDTIPPAIAAPADALVECGAATSTATLGEATASDLCGLLRVEHEDSFARACGDSGVLTRAFTATDECLLTSTDVQSITIQDTTAPALAAPPSATVECGEAEPSGEATATDTCGAATVDSVESFADGCGETGTRVRLFTATDACGNETTATQTVTVVDTKAPAIEVPPAATVECGEVTDTGTAAGADSCGAVTITSSDSSSPTCGGARVITRTFTATDDCGNPTTGEQVISVVDSAAPTVALAGRARVEVECGGTFEDPGASATDLCQGDLGAVPASGAVDTGTAGTYTLSYTAADECANASTATREVVVVDTTPPAIHCPANQVVVVECGTGEAPFELATATDGCGAATVTCDRTAAGVGTHTVTCTATDASGNSSSCAFQVEVQGGAADIEWRWPAEGEVHTFSAGQVIPVRIRGTGCDGLPAGTEVHAFLEVELDADGDGVYETELPEHFVGEGLPYGQMERGWLGYGFRYNLLTWSYPFDTASSAASLRLTVRLMRPSAEGPVTVREESVILESRGWSW